ncbi:ABC transporter permease [Gorillibacterium massiliense]|uniref:ABC transporter permease n=1 Tax=Gorillibacterium massiliense TaxID=1280390 RepID=UPI0004B4286E|nr:ABC transporter permease [Gorillibacterium massiliense]
MNMMLEIGLLFKRKMLETLRQPVWIISGMMTPILYLLLFSPLLKGLNSPVLGGSGNVIDTFVPGILALMAFGAGTGSGWTVIWELQSGVIERLRVSPASRFSLLMGTVLRDTVMLLLPAILVIFTASLFGFDLHGGGLVAMLLLHSLLTAVVSATSGSLGLILKNIGSLAAVVTGLQLPITLLAGVLLPLSLGPEWLRIVAHFNPLYYVVEASRVLGGGTILDGKVYEAFGVMAALMVIVLWWSTRVYRKAVA